MPTNPEHVCYLANNGPNADVVFRPFMARSGLRGDAAGARVGIEDHNVCEGIALPPHCFATAILRENSGEDQVLMKIYCRINCPHKNVLAKYLKSTLVYILRAAYVI